MAKTSKDVYKEFYPKLLEILPVDCLTTQLYSKELLSSDQKSKLDGLSTGKERAKYFLDEVIEPGLNIDYMYQFNEMLAIMEKSDDPRVKFLANKMKESCSISTPPSAAFHDPSKDLMLHETNQDQGRSQDAEPQTKLQVKDPSNALVVKYPPYEIHKAYHRLTGEITDILAAKNFKKLRRACYQEISAPTSTLPKSLVQELELTKSSDDMLDVLAKSPYWNWFDTRLLQALISASGSPEAEAMLEQFKQIYYSCKVSEVLPCVIVRPIKDSVSIVEKFDKDPNELTLLDLLQHKQILEYEVMDIGENKIILSGIKTGCVELTWQIPQELVYRAYTSMKRKHDVLSSLAVKSLVCEEADEFAGLPFLWRGQEVGEVGPIEPLPEHVRQEPYSLPQGFHWVTLSSSNAEEVMKFVNKIVDKGIGVSLFNFITSHPNTRSEWQFGIRASNGKLVGVVFASPMCISIGGKSVTCVQPLIQCHSKYRNKRLFYVLIKELIRRVNLCNINQLFFNLQYLVIKPVSTVHVWRYAFDHPTNSQLPSSPRTPGWRRMTSEDVPSALALINKWSSQFEIRQVFDNEEELVHHFLCPTVPNFVFTYVVENETNNITDLVSFRLVNKLLLAYICTVASTQSSVEQLIMDALVCAKEIGSKQLTMSSHCGVNPDVLSLPFFQYEDKSLTLSIYNYKCHEVPETKIWGFFS